MLLTETETSKEHMLVVQFVTQKRLHEISIKIADQAIAILGRVCFKNLQNLFKEPIIIKSNKLKNLNFCAKLRRT